jgi:hypothetical protein
MIDAQRRNKENRVSNKHVEMAVENLIRRHIKELNNKTIFRKVMDILHTAGKPFKAIYDSIYSALTQPPKPNPGPHPGDTERYLRGRQLYGPVPRDPYV